MSLALGALAACLAGVPGTAAATPAPATPPAPLIASAPAPAAAPPEVLAPLATASPSPAADLATADGDASADVAALTARGWDLLYDLDYEGAVRTFRAIQRVAPESPRGYMHEAVAVWFRELERRQDIDVTRYVDSTHFADDDVVAKDPEAETRFDLLLEKARMKGEERLLAEPGDVETLYLLGSVYGTRAGFEVTVRHQVSAALKAAKEAWKLQRRVIEKDPQYWDAYLPLGLYEYTTGSLPLMVKWVAVLAGFRGDKREGLRKIELAAEQGKTSARDAKTILSVIYAREGRVDEAIPLLAELSDLAPHNHVLRLNQAYCLARAGRYLEAAGAYASALRVARPEARFRREEVRLMMARSYLHAADPARAHQLSDALLEDAGLEPALRTRVQLLDAQALDALGRREEAVALYRVVAAAENVRGTRDVARRGLKTPFVAPGAMAAERPGSGSGSAPDDAPAPAETPP